MRRLATLPIRLQLLLLAGLVALPGLTLLTWSGLYLRAEAMDRARVEAQRLADGLAGQHETVVAGLHQLLVALSRLPQLRAHDPSVQPILAELHAQNPHLLNLFVVDRAGVVWSSAVGGIGHRSDDRPYFRRARETGRLAVGEYAVGRSTGKATLQFAYPYVGPQGEFGGVIGVALALESYAAVLERHPLPTGASYLLVDRDGIILTRSAERERYQGRPFIPATFAAMRAAPDTGTDVRMTMVGDERVVAWRKLRLPGEAEPYLYVRTGLPVAGVLEAANRELGRNLALALALLLPALALVAWAGKRWVVDRLRLLEAASARMAAGDLEARVAAQVQGGELGSLAAAFDRMAGQLAARAQALALSERSYREILDGTQDAILVHDPATARILDANLAAERLFGRPRAGLLDVTAAALAAEAAGGEEALRRIRLAVEEGPQGFEVLGRRGDGGTFWAEVRLGAATIGGQPRVVATLHDVSARRAAQAEAERLQAQLAQAQRLESVGRLAGGVAHDINNMLAVVLGEAELLKAELPPGHPGQQAAAEIERAGVRSRDITRQLLAFSRKQVASPRPVALQAHLAAAHSTLSRLVGQDYRLVLEVPADAWQARVDPAQLDQVLVNLLVNARDAMPDGGTVRIGVDNVSLDEAACRPHAGARPGDYVRLRVTDEGVGMDEATLARVFEPFFTTKEAQQGTGLGLATVYGIAAQGGGFVAARSAPGRGSTFEVYLPRSVEPAGAAAPGAAEAEAGSGVVLLVEDDEPVRRTARRMLESLGYRVVVAATPEEALAACADPARRLDLLLTDVVMPGMRGPELRRRVAALRPGLPAVFMSGHTADAHLRDEAAGGRVHFLQKPFTRADMAERLREALGR